LNAEANFLQTSKKPKVKSSYVFIDDKRHDRTFLLDTGANRNMIDASVLSKKELTEVDRSVSVSVANIQQGSSGLKSLGEINLPIPHKEKHVILKFIVMPPHTLNYNLIGVSAIIKNFLPLLQELSQNQEVNDKINQFQIELNQIQTEKAEKEESIETLTDEEAKEYLEILPTPLCPPPPQQKDVIDQEWFAKL